MSSAKIVEFSQNRRRLGTRPVEAANAAVNSLWERYLRLIAESRRVCAEIREAEARLPEWACSGPKYLDECGRLTGTHSVGWPQDLSVKPQLGRQVLARIGPKDIRDSYQQELGLPDLRRGARERYRARMRALVARLRDQRGQRDRVGLTELELRETNNYKKRMGILRGIEKVAVCANSVAALCLINSPQNDEAGLLDYLETSTTGLVRHAVSEWLKGDPVQKPLWVA
jgi:hypothetical protein